jgi:NitT/TauT family transport system substrate-binding protein
VSGKINLSEQTIARTWREFTFPASLPRDLRDVMTEEESWAAAVQRRQPRSRSAVERLIDDSIWREADAAHR